MGITEYKISTREGDSNIPSLVGSMGPGATCKVVPFCSNPGLFDKWSILSSVPQ